MEEVVAIEFDSKAAVEALSGVKEQLIGTVKQYPKNPGVHNVVRQAIDHLDAAYLFTSSLVSMLTAMDSSAEEAAKQAIAEGKVVDFGAKTEA